MPEPKPAETRSSNSKASRKVYTKSKEPVVALSEVDLLVAGTAQVVSIMGPSGSGKSTLLSILGLLDQPTSGVYALEGVDLTGLKDRELARIRRDHFGFIFQHYNLFPELTAVENVEVPMIYAGRPAGTGVAERKSSSNRWALDTGSTIVQARCPEASSNARRSPRALANSPTILFADEPTGNLPTEQGHQVMQALKDLNLHGMTVLVVTHNPGIALWSDRLLTARDGRTSPISRRRQAGSSRRKAALWTEMSHLDLEAPGEISQLVQAGVPANVPPDRSGRTGGLTPPLPSPPSAR